MASKKVKMARGIQKIFTFATAIGGLIIEWKIMGRIDFMRRSILTKMFLKIGIYIATLGLWKSFCASCHMLLDGVAQKWIDKQERKKVAKKEEKNRRKNGNNKFTDFRANAIEVDYDIVSEVCI